MKIFKSLPNQITNTCVHLEKNMHVCAQLQYIYRFNNLSTTTKKKLLWFFSYTFFVCFLLKLYFLWHFHWFRLIRLNVVCVYVCRFIKIYCWTKKWYSLSETFFIVVFAKWKWRKKIFTATHTHTYTNAYIKICVYNLRIISIAIHQLQYIIWIFWACLIFFVDYAVFCFVFNFI